MASNSFGHIFKFTSFGESHGKAIGCVVDGIPPLVPIEEKDIQSYLDRRKLLVSLNLLHKEKKVILLKSFLVLLKERQLVTLCHYLL